MLKQSDLEFQAICIQESWIVEGEDYFTNTIGGL